MKITHKIDIFLAFYKHYISPLFPPACRFYPTCSEYAALCFRFSNPISASFKSILRILHCNQLFSGGVSYPKITLDLAKITPKVPLLTQDSHKIAKNIAFWLIPADANLNTKNAKNNAKIAKKFFAIKSLTQNQTKG